jgi:biotin-dependent carboxylase-like uncharacterized protein
MSLRVLDPGLHSRIVDAGRPNWRSLGVSVGGAADREALAIGNALVGNAPEAAAVEISLAGPTLQAECDLACVVNGAPYEMEAGGRRLQSGRTFFLHAGDTLEIGGTPSRLRAYLCVHGGIHVAPILGSRSALQPLKSGDLLPCQPGIVATRWLPDTDSMDPGPVILGYLDGPQTDWFGSQDLMERSFTVSPASDRMGVRLNGPALTVPKRELVSEPVCPGTVQVTRDGQCIILGVDGQTIGGYAKIAQVISADLDRVGQLRPGVSVGFRRLTLDEAENVFHSRQTQLQERLMRLRETWSGN